jgi:hypothetical protein
MMNEAFDQDIADLIIEDIKTHNNVNIVPTSLPFDVQKTDNNKLFIKWRNTQSGEIGQDGWLLKILYEI